MSVELLPDEKILWQGKPVPRAGVMRAGFVRADLPWVLRCLLVITVCAVVSAAALP